MLIAISANNANVESPFESRFGRAAGFVLYETADGSYRFVENMENSQLAQGAGIQTAQMLADKGVEVVISGSFGPKASEALRQGHIEMVESTGGTVHEVVDNYLVSKSGTADRPESVTGSAVSGGVRAGSGCRRMGGTGMGRGRGGGRGMGGRGRV